MSRLVHKNGMILGIEPDDYPEELILSKYPPGSKVISSAPSGFSLSEIKRNWRIVDGELVRRPLVSLFVTPEITYPGEPVTVRARVCHFLPEERRESLLLRAGRETLSIELADDELIPGHLVGQASLVLERSGNYLIELADWPEADCVPRPVTVV